MIRRPIHLLALLMAFMLLVTGCEVGSSEEDDPTATVEQQATTPDQADTTTTADADEVAGTSTSDFAVEATPTTTTGDAAATPTETSSDTAVASPGTGGSPVAAYDPQDSFRSSWSPGAVEGLSLNEANTAPVFDPDTIEPVFDDYYIWDWWPVRDRQGNVAEIDGWQVIIGLTSPNDVLPGTRHDIATYRYLMSQDGQNWQEGGEVFAEGDAIGSRQWAGSSMYDADSGEIYVFYTAAGREDSAEDNATPDTSGTPEEGEGNYTSSGDISYEQRMAMAVGTVDATESGITFTDWSDHQVILEADDEYYKSTRETTGGAGNIDAFRDPWFFQDPETGREFLLFTATMPDAECDADGVVGIAEAASDDLMSWELLPPLLDGLCVNNELERPHIIMQDDQYYLFFTTHAHTFDPVLEGPEGLYGFVADSLRGVYQPLNGTGLVLANPDEAPYQAYSWLMLPGGLATSFFNFHSLEEGVSIDYIGQQDPEYQFEHFGGTLAPTIQVEIDGTETHVVEELEPGVISTN